MKTINGYYPDEEKIREEVDKGKIRAYFNSYFIILSLDFIREFQDIIDWRIIYRDWRKVLSERMKHEFRNYLDVFK